MEIYRENLPINTDLKFFRAIEAIVCGYHHIGAIIYGMKSLWNKIKEFKNIEENLNEYLKSKNKSTNWEELNKEPKYIRDKLVHIGRHVFDIIGGELYFPKEIPEELEWTEVNSRVMMPADIKLEKHIELACKSCEDIYQELIDIFSEYLEKEGIKI